MPLTRQQRARLNDPVAPIPNQALPEPPAGFEDSQHHQGPDIDGSVQALDFSQYITYPEGSDQAPNFEEENLGSSGENPIIPIINLSQPEGEATAAPGIEQVPIVNGLGRLPPLRFPGSMTLFNRVRPMIAPPPTHGGVTSSPDITPSAQRHTETLLSASNSTTLAGLPDRAQMEEDRHYRQLENHQTPALRRLSSPPPFGGVTTRTPQQPATPYERLGAPLALLGNPTTGATPLELQPTPSHGLPHPQERLSPSVDLISQAESIQGYQELEGVHCLLIINDHRGAFIQQQVPLLVESLPILRSSLTVDADITMVSSRTLLAGLVNDPLGRFKHRLVNVTGSVRTSRIPIWNDPSLVTTILGDVEGLLRLPEAMSRTILSILVDHPASAVLALNHPHINLRKTFMLFFDLFPGGSADLQPPSILACHPGDRPVTLSMGQQLEGQTIGLGSEAEIPAPLPTTSSAPTLLQLAILDHVRSQYPDLADRAEFRDAETLYLMMVSYAALDRILVRSFQLKPLADTKWDRQVARVPYQPVAGQPGQGFLEVSLEEIVSAFGWKMNTLKNKRNMYSRSEVVANSRWPYPVPTNKNDLYFEEYQAWLALRFMSKAVSVNGGAPRTAADVQSAIHLLEAGELTASLLSQAGLLKLTQLLEEFLTIPSRFH